MFAFIKRVSCCCLLYALTLISQNSAQAQEKHLFTPNDEQAARQIYAEAENVNRNEIQQSVAQEVREVDIFSMDAAQVDKLKADLTRNFNSPGGGASAQEMLTVQQFFPNMAIAGSATCSRREDANGNYSCPWIGDCERGEMCLLHSFMTVKYCSCEKIKDLVRSLLE